MKWNNLNNPCETHNEMTTLNLVLDTLEVIELSLSELFCL